MASVDTALRDRYGLHPRAAMRIQQAAAAFRARVTLQGLAGSGPRTDAASMIALVAAGIRPGEMVRVTAEGEDAEAAVAAIAELLARGVCHP